MATLPSLTQFDFHQVLMDTSGESLVIFTSENCSSCRYWKRLLYEYRGRHPELHLYEVDAQRDAALTREFEVFHLPALFLFRDGQFHGALQSEARLDALERAIGKAFEAPPQEPP